MNRRDLLRHHLTRFAPADAREEGFQRRMLDLLDVDGDPFSRDHFDPGHFTASAFILSPGGDKLLMIFHQKLRLWLQPGGHVDPTDADIFAAALREIEEETGVTDVTWFEGEPAIFDVDIHTIPPLKGDPPHEHFDVRVLVTAPSTAFEAGSDAEDARWIAVEAITEAETDESVMRAVRKVRGL